MIIMSNTEKMLDIQNLSVIYKTDLETVYAVNDVTLSLEKGATLGLVGETGAGKTTLALTLMRLLPERTGKVTSGSITFEGENIVELPEAHMRKIRGDKIAMIFQDPMSSLNPLIPVGKQVAEMLLEHHKDISGEEAKKEEQPEEGVPVHRVLNAWLNQEPCEIPVITSDGRYKGFESWPY